MQGRTAANASITGLRAPVFAILMIFVVVFATLWGHSAEAVEATGLYRVTLPVADRSQDARNAAFQQALGQVLIKVSGDSQITAQPSVQQALQNPSTYVQQFAYQEAASAATSSATTSASTAAPPPALDLQVRFDPVAVNRLLTTNNLPLWGRERPLVILWVGVSRGNGQRFILSSDGDSSHPQARQAVQQAAQARGLPIFLPLMDLQDQSAIRFSDLGGGFMTPIRQASQRYDANAMLAGVARPVGGRWIGQWRLAFRSQVEQWSSEGATEAQALAGAVNGAADRLSSMLAVAGSGDVGQQAIFVQIDGVRNVAAFARIEHLLDKLTPVKSAQLSSADGGQVVFRVVPRGQPGDVARNLGLVNWLQAMQSTPVATQAEAGQTLYFRYNP